MENTVVVGGNVQGNISSCEFKVSTMTLKRENPWIVTTQSMGVNNCTGETIKSTYWDMDSGATLVTLATIFLTGLAIAMVIDFMRH